MKMSTTLDVFIKAINSQKKSELAAELGCSRDYLYHYASGFRKPSKERLSIIHDYAEKQGFELIDDGVRLS